MFGDPRLPERFWTKVLQARSGCWIWTSAWTADGYGKFSLRGKMVRAHRLAFGVLVRAVADTEHVHHDCPNRLCVNPEHLRAMPAVEHNGHGRRDMTHCRRGHAFDEINTRISARGARECRECERARKRRQRIFPPK